MTTLFHGSNIPIDIIDLSKCLPYKDFGKGFYLTDIEAQAMDMAIRRVRIAGTGEPVVSAFSFDETVLQLPDFNILKFDVPTVAWAKFVLANRRDKSFVHRYDIVIGPIADDGVALQLDQYERGLISIEQLVDALTYKKLSSQYCFNSPKSISTLIKL